MTLAKFSAALLGSALLLSGSALAGTTNKKSLRLDESVVVEGKTLVPGDYKVEWNEPGPDVKVSIVQGKETVATFSAHEIPINDSNPRDGYSTDSSQDGSKTLKDLFFSGKKYELEIQTTSAPANAQSSGTGQQD